MPRPDESGCVVSRPQTGSRPSAVERILEASPVNEGEDAAIYERLVRRNAWLLDRPFVRQVAQAGPRCARVLDLGCGPGWVLIDLAQRHPDWELTGMDASGEMVARARRNARAAGVSTRIRFRKADACRTPFVSGGFDLVISKYLLHHIPTPVALLDEAARLCHKTGMVIITDLIRPPPWRAGLLTAFCRYLLRYEDRGSRMFRESLGAALSWSELREAVHQSALREARWQARWGLEFLLRARGSG